MSAESECHQHQRGTWSRDGALPLFTALIRIAAVVAVMWDVSGTVAHAGGGFGSVRGTSAANSITLSWDPPSGGYRYCGDSDVMICYKRAWDLDGACDGGTIVHVTGTSCVVGGLDFMTEYKFKVFARTERRNLLGKWKDCDYHKIGTLTQSTLDLSAGGGTIEIVGGEPGSISVKVVLNSPHRFERVRVGYKIAWSNWRLNHVCSDLARPVSQWGASNWRRGWQDDVDPTYTWSPISIPDLRDCYDYKLVAYGFESGSSNGVLIGEAKGRTGGSCGGALNAGAVLHTIVDDLPNVVHWYGAKLDSLYSPSLAGDSLFMHLASHYDHGLMLDRDSLMADGDTLTRNNFETLEYILNAHPAVFAAWQSEPRLVASGATLPAFVGRHAPAAWDSLLAQVSPLTLNLGTRIDDSTAIDPYSLAIGDLDGDWVPDLALANMHSNSVSVLLGNGDGTFSPRTDYPTGIQPHSVGIGDLNGDWIPDLMLANMGSNSVSVLLGNGDGTFGPKTDYPTGNSPFKAAIGDLNGDWIPDLAVANWSTSNTVSVLLGHGDGTFAPKTDIVVGAKPICVAIGDLNGDWRPDLAVVNQEANSLSILPGQGDGTFGPKTDYPTGSYPFYCEIGDLNGDWRPDLAVANRSSGTVSVMLGYGDGTFHPRADIATGSYPLGCGIGDLNGDWRPDLAVANFGSNTVSVLLGNGDGTFASKTDFVTGSGPIGCAIGDLDGDYIPDLAVANYSSSTASVFPNHSTSTLGVDRDPTVPPGVFQLLSARPNPSRGSSEIDYEVPAACVVEVNVFDLAGRKVRCLVSGQHVLAGPHVIRWDGRDASGAPVRPGVYMAQVRAGNSVGAKRMVVVR